jgi:hypothetical protein
MAPDGGGGEMEESEEMPCFPVVAGGDSAEVFEPVEASLDGKRGFLAVCTSWTGWVKL